MDELKGLIRDLDGDVSGLRTEATRREASQAGRDRRRDVLLVVLIVCVLVTGLFIWRFVAYSNCATNRAKALTGPGNERVSQLLGAFTASVTVQSADARRAALATLDEARGRYPLLPSAADLAKLPDSAVVGDAMAVRALDTNAKYQAAVKAHPVCSLWTLP